MARLGGRPGGDPRAGGPPQGPLAHRAGSGQSQAKGQVLGGLFHLQTISKMAGMFCLSKEPPGESIHSSGWVGTDTSPHSHAPQPPQALETQ